MDINERARQLAAEKSAAEEKANAKRLEEERLARQAEEAADANLREVKELAAKFAHWAQENSIPSSIKSFRVKGWEIIHETAEYGSNRYPHTKHTYLHVLSNGRIGTGTRSIVLVAVVPVVVEVPLRPPLDIPLTG